MHTKKFKGTLEKPMKLLNEMKRKRKGEREKERNSAEALERRDRTGKKDGQKPCVCHK